MTGFDRMSDGSYAYAGRKTYLKELEELNLDVVDLILGLSLRAENMAEKHYVGYCVATRLGDRVRVRIKTFLKRK